MLQALFGTIKNRWTICCQCHFNIANTVMSTFRFPRAYLHYFYVIRKLQHFRLRLGAVDCGGTEGNQFTTVSQYSSTIKAQVDTINNNFLKRQSLLFFIVMYFTRKVKRYRYESPREETREVRGQLALVRYSHMPCHIPLNEG